MYTPAYTKTLFDGAIQITVYGAVRNWNIAGATPQEMNTLNPGITKSIRWIIESHRIRRALAPKPSFNAKIATGADLVHERLERFFRGFDSDGALLQRKGDAYLLASADCPTVCLYDKKHHRAVGLHCGRDALVDRKHLEGAQARANSSVIDLAVKILTESGRSTAESLQAFIAAGISPDHFTHLTSETMLDSTGQVVRNPHKETNERLIQHLLAHWQGVFPHSPIVTDVQTGKIRLNTLIRAQLVCQKVCAESIDSDNCDTATDQDDKGNFLFHSYRRHRAYRNLVVVHLL